MLKRYKKSSEQPNVKSATLFEGTRFFKISDTTNIKTEKQLKEWINIPLTT
jgi:hypothetical protein